MLMDLMLDFKTEYAIFIVRVIVAILFIGQGYDKLFRIGLYQSGNAAADALHVLPFPPFAVKLITAATAIIEFFVGIMLLFGILIVPSCYVLITGLLPITIAMSMKEPLWNMQHVWTRLVMLVLLLVLPVSVHTISLDHFFGWYGA